MNIDQLLYDEQGDESKNLININTLLYSLIDFMYILFTLLNLLPLLYIYLH